MVLERLHQDPREGILMSLMRPWKMPCGMILIVLMWIVTSVATLAADISLEDAGHLLGSKMRESPLKTIDWGFFVRVWFFLGEVSLHLTTTGVGVGTYQSNMF